ncbi:hypothetical protein Tco_0857365 [Tanacetum coccineum]|uniref:Uncharacterized protein n=1 Tax=Tanacetum coccineum TaxID=301880 RepID=A0ABQ5BA01_9ASTR
MSWVLSSKASNQVVPNMLNTLSKKYSRLKETAKSLNINEDLPLPLQDPSLPKSSKKKRMAMELEPEVYIVGLDYDHSLLEGRVRDIHKVRTTTLLRYKMMAYSDKSDANQKFVALMDKLISKRPDKYALTS